MRFKVFNDVDTGRFFDLKATDVDSVNVRGVRDLKPFPLKPILRAMIREKGALTIRLDKTVAATIFLCGSRNRSGNTSSGELCADKVSVSTGTDR